MIQRKLEKSAGQNLKIKGKQTLPIFEWSEKYSVNVLEIDNQHKKLIGMVEQLNTAMRQGKGKEALGKILSDLINLPGVSGRQGHYRPGGDDVS
ncbi:MAG: hypothetical protein P4L43_19315 [Syntrophobacteraceae bacterium]|nr:hypothetical protein [Syntrophobacteraceae bacterium]